jgi:hypothetical protein
MAGFCGSELYVFAIVRKISSEIRGTGHLTP